jgi:hypothetical protein
VEEDLLKALIAANCVDKENQGSLECEITALIEHVVSSNRHASKDCLAEMCSHG